jgi:hypothetical protein
MENFGFKFGVFLFGFYLVIRIYQFVIGFLTI